MLQSMGSQTVEHTWMTELNWLIVSFKVCVSLLIFCLVNLSIGVSRLLQSPTLIVLPLIYPFILVNICPMYWGAPTLGASVQISSVQFGHSVVSNSLRPHDPGLISFRMDWLDLLAGQGTLKSLLQHHSSKASILQHSAFFTVQLSHPYMTTGRTIALMRRTFVYYNSKNKINTHTSLKPKVKYTWLKNQKIG